MLPFPVWLTFHGRVERLRQKVEKLLFMAQGPLKWLLQDLSHELQPRAVLRIITLHAKHFRCVCPLGDRRIAPLREQQPSFPRTHKCEPRRPVPPSHDGCSNLARSSSSSVKSRSGRWIRKVLCSSLFTTSGIDNCYPQGLIPPSWACALQC
jgi:hypothetical protein